MVYDPKDFLLIQGHNLVQKGKTERNFMYCAAFFNFHWVTTLWTCSNKSGLGDETLFPLKGSKAFPSLLLRRFISRIVEASAKRERLVMNRKGPWKRYRWRAKPHVSPVVSFPPSFARSFSSRERETSGYEAGVFLCLLDWCVVMPAGSYFQGTQCTDRQRIPRLENLWFFCLKSSTENKKEKVSRKKNSLVRRRTPQQLL